MLHRFQFYSKGTEYSPSVIAYYYCLLNYYSFVDRNALSSTII